MIPTREEAMEFIRDGLACNPGPWGRHCLTAAHCAEKIAHSFNNHRIDDYIGKFDVSDEELRLIKTELDKVVFDEYDRLIQLCDSLAGAGGVLDVEERMKDVKKRYGFYPQAKWDTNIRLMQHFEKKMNQNIYIVCERDTFVPEDI